MASVHRSRWGYHPCSYETFQLLKRLNALYEKTLRRLGEWKRWSRKQPQNRVRRQKVRDGQGNCVGMQILGPWPEPALCPVFCKRGEVIRRHGDLAGGGAITVVQLLHRDIPDVYRAARTPVSSPEQVAPLGYGAEELRALLIEAEAWYCQESAVPPQ